jgi:hypothetical protein
MKPVLILLFFLLSSMGYGQPCDYDIRETDDFMGTSRIATVPQTVWSDENEAIVFVLSSDNGIKALEIVHMKRDSEMLCFDEGSFLELILESGDSIRMNNFTGAGCADGQYSDIHKTMEHFLGCGFRIDPKTEKNLKTHAIKEFKIYFENGKCDVYPLPEKVVLHEKGFDLYGRSDYPAHVFFVETLPCID